MTPYCEKIGLSGLDARTVEAAAQAEQWYDALAGQTLKRATPDGVDRFLRGLQRRAKIGQAAARTCAQRWLAARRAVQWYGRTAAAARMREVVIVKALKLQREDGDWRQKAFNTDEAARFMAAAGEIVKPTWVRQLFVLFAATGARLSELIGLRVGDVDAAAGLLNVVGKFSRRRVVAVIGEAGRAALRAQVQARLGEGADAGSALFVTLQAKSEHGRWWRADAAEDASREARHVSARAVQWWADKLARRAGVKAGRRCVHVFRHTLATRLAENDVALGKIATLLGHQNVQTTMRYVHLQAEAAREAAEAALPSEMQFAEPRAQEGVVVAQARVIGREIAVERAAEGEDRSGEGQ
jgi:integrase